MRSKPAWLNLIAVAFLFVALSFPMQIMLIYGHSWSELSAVFNKLTVLNLIVIAGLISCSYLLWRAAPICRMAVPFTIAAVIVNNGVVGYYAIDYSFWYAHLATVGFVCLNLPLAFDARVQWILNHPEKRWWVRAERKRLAVPVTIEGTRLEPVKFETFDISRSGAFVSGLHDFGVGDWITVRLILGDLAHVQCRARVVRRTDAAGIYPPGIGVKFMNLGWRQRRELSRYLTA